MSRHKNIFVRRYFMPNKRGLLFIGIFICLIFLVNSIIFANQEVQEDQEIENLLDKGISSFNEDKFEEALEYFNKVLELNNKHEKAWFCKMQVLFYTNKPNEELKAINDFLQIFPND